MAPASAPRPKARGGGHILLVDDSLDSREMYAEYLGSIGFRCDVAADGEEAVARARDEPPDVIVMDLAMPRLDGLAAIRRLRADPGTSEIAIVILTSQEGRFDCPRRARECCVDAFLSKPCLPRELAAELNRVSRRARG